LTTIKSFSGADGAYPTGGVVLSEGVLYGTTLGWAKMGPTIFRVNTDGTEFRTLYTNLIDVGLYHVYPEGLLVVGKTLYGTTHYGGAQDMGTIFTLDIDGDNFTNIYSFTTNQDAAHPYPGLVLDGTNFYGTGGRAVFKIDINGGGYSNLHVFTNGPDGGVPWSGLLLSEGVLYGVAAFGSGGHGVVFKVNVDGSGFTNIHSFSDYESGEPIGRLTISGNTLYGTTESSYMSPNAVFKVNTDGSGFALAGIPVAGTPRPGGLVLLGNTLYGTTRDYYYPQLNLVYKINVDVSGFAIVYRFANIAIPQGDLISSGGILYGTTYAGQTVFALDPAILLRGAVLNGNIVLNWYDPSFQLQSAPTVTGPYTNIAGAASPYTNAAISPQQFFRLQHQ
jgi:uncharacterized repeat protein (TIGR03803 family)